MPIHWHRDRFVERKTAERVECKICSKPMWLPKSKVGMYLTCSEECQGTLKSSGKVSRTRACETCGRTFTPRQWQLSVGGGRFCSQRCNIAGRAAMNAVEAQVRARQTARELRKIKPFNKSGPDHPQWKGGRKAVYERRKASGVYRDNNNKRRCARRRNLPKGWIPFLEEKQKMSCANCRCSLKDGYHLDHIKPLSKGGEHCPMNVELLCPKCNHKKTNKMPDEWAKENGRLL